jgi:transcriptional regulator GlxA family with amidase domain
MRYLQRLRLAAAVERITHTSDTFRQIAEACVLGSASHLWSLVKREYGRSPAELRGEVHGRLRPPGDSS